MYIISSGYEAPIMGLTMYRFEQWRSLNRFRILQRIIYIPFSWRLVPRPMRLVLALYTYAALTVLFRITNIADPWSSLPLIWLIDL